MLNSVIQPELCQTLLEVVGSLKDMFFSCCHAFCLGDTHPDEISVIAVDRDLVFTGCQNVIRAFTRGKQVRAIITAVKIP